MDKLKMHSLDMTADNIKKIAAIFPNCVTESANTVGELKQSIDFDLLKQELSGSIVDGPQERYHLNWPGKRKALLTANAPIAKTLRPCRKESVDFDQTKNLFIEGDNLDALKLLQETYLEQVKIIYIDPPYNTGTDFIYKDNFAEDIDSYKTRSNQMDDIGNRLVSNIDTNGRFHSDWLSMMYSRLKLAINMLDENGIIAISIDDNEVENVSKLIDELLGDGKRKNICVKMSEPTGVKMASVNKSKGIAKLKEYVVLASKTGINNIELEKMPKANWDHEYKTVCKGLTVDELKEVKDWLECENRSDKDTSKINELIDRISFHSIKEVALEEHVDDVSEKWLFENAWRIVQFATLTGGARDIAVDKKLSYQDVPNAFTITTSSDKAYLIKGGFNHDSRLPRCKVLFSDKYLEVHIGDFWTDIKTTGLDNEGDVDFKNGKKPLKLLNRLIKMKATDNDIVMDFFSGSGSFLEATLKYNAAQNSNVRFIGVQIAEEISKKDQPESFDFCKKNGFPPYITEICKERVRRAGKNIKAEYGDVKDFDMGFRVLKIDTSNMTEVYYNPENTSQTDMFAQVENIKEDRADEDLLFQVLLDWGVGLTLPISKQQISGKDVFFVNGDSEGEGADLIACFSKNITDELVKELAKLQPLRVVFRDDGFGDGFDADAVKINAEQIFKQLSPTTDIKSL